MGYVELQVTSNFSFLRGGSHPEELVEHAVALGYKAIAITDRNSLAGIVRAYTVAQVLGIRFITGCRLDLRDGPSLLAYPTNVEAYGRLSTLLSTGNLRAEKGKCFLYQKDVFENAKGLKFILLPPERLNQRFEFEAIFRSHVAHYKKKLGAHLYLAASRSYHGDDERKLARLAAMAREFDVPLIATNDVHYHSPDRKELQDVLTCIREKCTIYEAGYRLHQNAERFLKPAEEMHRLFRKYPQAIQSAEELANACQFDLSSLKFDYPVHLPEGKSALGEVARFSIRGAKKRFGGTIPPDVRKKLLYELDFIKRNDYAKFFYNVHGVTRIANRLKILYKGRGSAANSTICYCLGITSVNPLKHRLLFERFASDARKEPPDIDIDFEHSRREELFQEIYKQYGRDHAAIISTVTMMGSRGAIRDVAKVMGLSEDAINRLSNSVWEHTNEWFDDKRLIVQGINPEETLIRKILSLTQQYKGFPRQLGQHPSGFILTESTLGSLCPVYKASMPNRTNVEWNKDDLDNLGGIKVDMLALGVLTCLRRAFELIKEFYGIEYDFYSIPQDDPLVYDMICRADTIGAFQIESEAQRASLKKTQPRTFFDLVIQVAIVRPGPILGDMVNPYIRRRNGKEPVEYPSKEMEEILGPTLGVPLFQEQAMSIAIDAADFTPTEADQLRKAMATFKLKGLVAHFEQKLITGMVAKGYTLEYAQRVFRQLEGFGSYGFPQSHAIEFAETAYVTAYLKYYYPDIYLAGALYAMPWAYWKEGIFIDDARQHRVDVRPIDVNHSVWDTMPQEKAGKYFAIRLGFKLVNGLEVKQVEKLVKGRTRPYRSIQELHNAGISESTLRLLAEADAFRSMKLERRKALWEIAALKDAPLDLFKDLPSDSAYEAPAALPEISASEHVIQDYSATGFSIKDHPLKFLREQMTAMHIKSARELESLPDGAYIRISGLPLVRTRPGTAGGICFLTLQDETGMSRLVIFSKLFDEFRKEINQARLLMVDGRVQRQDNSIHIVVKKCYSLDNLIHQLVPAQRHQIDLLLPATIVTSPLPFKSYNKRAQIREKPAEEAMPKARNFR